MKQKNSPTSLIMLISSMLIYGSIGIFRKFIPLSSSMLAFTRGIIGAIFIAIVFFIKGRGAFSKPTGKTLGLLFASGALIGINWMMLFEAYNYTTVAIATLCYYMEPIILILLAPVFFKEKLTIPKIICMCTAFLGMLLISGLFDEGGFDIHQLRGIFLGLGAAIIYAFVIILNKRLPEINTYEKTAYQLLFAGIAMIPYLLITCKITSGSIDTKATVLIILVGIIHTGIAYTLYFGSIKGLRAGTLALFSYIDPITAIVLSALILGEPLTIFSVIGGILIIGSTIINEFVSV